jgi:uncharacterized protein (TIGR02147 family)
MANASTEMILAKFYERKTRNPGYTLRAFSRDLAISSGTLSELLNEKRTLTPKKAQTIATKLFSDGETRQRFLSSLPEKPAPEKSVVKHLKHTNSYALTQDTFQVIADWQHYAILNLVETSNFEHSYKHISERLGISAKTAKDSVERLLRIGLLRFVNKKWQRTREQVTTSFDHASTALKHSHRQTLEQTIECIEGVAITDRELISCTLAFDPADMDVAKKQIRAFASSFKQVLPRRNKSEVYNMNIQLVPVTTLRRRS